MAFALAIKSKFDLPRVGSIFLLLTLLITAFTLIYSALFLETTLNICDVILRDSPTNDQKTQLIRKNSNHDNKKVAFKRNTKNYENEDDADEKIINHSFLHEDLDEIEEEQRKKKYSKNYSQKASVNSQNYFNIVKNKLMQLNEQHLLPIIDREERQSVRLSMDFDAELESKFELVKKDFSKKNCE